MNRTLIFEYKILVEGNDEPEMTGRVRFPWPEDETIEDVVSSLSEKACRDLRRPKVVTVTA